MKKLSALKGKVLGITWSLLTFGSLASTAQGAHAVPIYNPANGHYYEQITVAGNINGTDAKAAAAAKSYKGFVGHLATITSANENSFIYNNLTVAIQGNYWIGGYQDKTAPDYVEPAGGWRWVTGESFAAYQNWQTNEPNNALGYPPSEEGMQILLNGKWNDAPLSNALGGYIVEYDVPLSNGLWILEMIPAPIKGGTWGVAQVTLTSPAPTGGVTVQLSSNKPSVASVRSSVSIPAGEISVFFYVMTSYVGVDTPVTLSATANGTTVTRSFTVKR